MQTNVGAARQSSCVLVGVWKFKRWVHSASVVGSGIAIVLDKLQLKSPLVSMHSPFLGRGVAWLVDCIRSKISSQSSAWMLGFG